MSTPPPLPTLPDANASLSQWQTYLQQLCQARGWDSATHLQTWLLLTEELGELAKAIRQQDGLFQEAGKNPSLNLQEEFADVFSYLFQLANQCGVDLAEAIRHKEQRNAQRHWQ